MVSMQSTTIPLDFTHLQPKFKNGDLRNCYMNPTEDQDSIFDILADDRANFRLFMFILQYSGLAEKYRRKNGYTLAVVPDTFLKDVCVNKMSRAEARRIVLRHTIPDAIRLSDLGCDQLWIHNGMDEFFTLSRRSWNDAVVMGTRQCSNGYIYVVDRLIC